MIHYELWIELYLGLWHLCYKPKNGISIYRASRQRAKTMPNQAIIYRRYYVNEVLTKLP